MRDSTSDPAAQQPDADVLIQRYLEDSISEEEAAVLLQLLQAEPGEGLLKQRLLGQLHLDAMLRETKPLLGLAAPPGFRPPIQARAAVARARFSFAAVAGIAALAACIALAGAWLVMAMLPGESGTLAGETEEEPETTTAAVAVLARGVNVEWDGAAHAPGSPLAPGWLRIKSGLAQIEFYQGARVTLEGPAAFRLISANEAFCSAGKLSAHVPPQAKGFRIDTPKGTIVDLGTDFGLDLNAPAAELHVFKGEVELHAKGAAMKALKEGQGLTLEEQERQLLANASAFASLAGLEERTAESQRLAFENWLQQAAAWDDDPRLLMRLDFQDAAGARSLRNHAARSPQVPAGSIVGCDWTEGRWPGKRALEFRNVSDRVRLSVPGDHKALTLSAWVRVQGLDRAFNSLFMVEGYEDGAVHWQITRDGKLRLGLAGRGGAVSKDYDAQELFTPERFGQWLHLATVVDPEKKEVRHYLNGECVARVPRAEIFPVRLAVADLGNWNYGGRSDRVAVRHFSGAMDEFMLFSQALPDAEISRLSASDRP